MNTRRETRFALPLPVMFLVAAIFSLAGGNGQAGTTTVTLGGEGSPWTVADPVYGDYTVTVTGGEYTGPHGGSYYYRNTSGAAENDDTITWTVSDLPAGAYITDFLLTETGVTPSVGSGNGSYDITLSGPGSSGTVSDARSSTDILVDFTPVSPELSISDASFGNAPAFTLDIDEIAAYTTRTIGNRNFNITAAGPASSVRRTFSMTSISGDPTSTTTVSKGPWGTDVTLDDTGSPSSWVTSGLLDPPTGGFIRHGSSVSANTARFTIDAPDPTGGSLPSVPVNYPPFEGWELVELSVTFDSTEVRSGDTPNDLTLTDGTLTNSLTGYLESAAAGTLTLTGSYDAPIGLSTFTVVQQSTSPGDSGERLEIIEIELSFENQSNRPSGTMFYFQ